MRRITVKEIKAIKEPGRYRADPTLYLNVAPGGSKSWVQRIFTNGVQRDIGLGGFPLVTLVDARELAFSNRRRARRGEVIQTPAEKRAEKRVEKFKTVPSFYEAAVKTHAAKFPTPQSRKSGASWLAQLERHAFARLGPLAVDKIGRAEVLAVISPLWGTKHETARKVRRNIRATLDWCIGQGYVETNYASEIINGALPRSRKDAKSHLRAMPYHDVADALVTIENSNSAPVVSDCLRFVVLTAVRSGEARNAAWSEINFDTRTWRIPAERTKTQCEHRVPLSDAALDILESMRALNGGSGLIFPSPRKRGKPLSDMSLTKLLRDTGLADIATVHGFRSSFRDWCAETGKPREIAEAALAHVVAGVEGSYFRSDLFAKRERLMSQWAAYLTGEKTGKVITLHADKSA